jgi:hypothetical protein
MDQTFPIKITPGEANLASAAVMATLYAAYGEDPLRWKEMDEPSRKVIESLQDIHLRLEYFLDPWEVDVNFFSVTVQEAKLLRLSFRIFSNCFPKASQQDLQELFGQIDDCKMKGAGLLQGVRKIDNRLASLISENTRSKVH